MTPTFTQDAKNTWRIVGFFTDKYLWHANTFIESLKKFPVSASVYRVDDLGNWHKNTHYKSTFLKKCLALHPEHLVYIDCDAVLIEYPSLFDNLDCEVACWRVPRRYGGHLSNGTIYLKNNKNVARFIQIWEAKCNENQTDCFEQEKFERSVNETGVLFAELPITYCQIYDFPIKPEGSVIIHNQASRQMRGR